MRLFLALSGLIFAPLFAQASISQDLLERREWVLENLLANLERGDISPGAVIASPSRQAPNYFLHWIRDSGLVMAALVQELDDPLADVGTRERLERVVRAWVAFESRLQETPNRSGGLGEPRFQVDGRADDSDWGRPQNDGPALRASAMIDFAWREIRAGRKREVLQQLYRAELPARTAIKKDLEYVAHHWREDGFDLWEEVKGHHYFTRAVQRRALLKGAALANELGDPDAARFYTQQAGLISASLEEFHSAARGYAVPTIGQTGGWTHKTSELDVSVILGAIHGAAEPGAHARLHAAPAVQATARELRNAFLKLYPLNQGVLSETASARELRNAFVGLYPVNRAVQSRGGPAAAIGRYPEDVYDGNGFTGGNPWFLATHAYAEWHCRGGEGTAGEQALGLRYLERSVQHQGPHATMSEQFRRGDGFLQGARDLTWSYASFLTAARACLL